MAVLFYVSSLSLIRVGKAAFILGINLYDGGQCKANKPHRSLCIEEILSYSTDQIKLSDHGWQWAGSRSNPLNLLSLNGEHWKWLDKGKDAHCYGNRGVQSSEQSPWIWYPESHQTLFLAYGLLTSLLWSGCFPRDYSIGMLEAGTSKREKKEEE